MPRSPDPDPDELCLARFRTRLAHEGFFDESGLIWAQDGTVLAQSRQLALLLPCVRVAAWATTREAHRRDGGRFRRRVRQGARRAGCDGLRHAGHPAAAELRRLPRARPRRSGQEEVFLAIGGNGWIEIDGERVELDPETFVRIGPEPRRKVYAGPEGLRLLALGGAPGEAYKIVPLTELGAAS